MHPNCIAEVAAAIGRQPTRAEIAEFEGGLLEQMREIARSDRQKWTQMTGPQRVQAAAELATQAAIERADVQAQRRAANLVAQAKAAKQFADRRAALKKRGRKKAGHAAVFEWMRQAETYVNGVRNEAMTGLIDAVEAVRPGFVGFLQDTAKIRAFAKAVLDNDTSDPDMTKAAKAYLDTVENLRVRQNAAGADIAKLDYSYLPQPHDIGLVARTGADAWAEKVLPMLARDRYVRADGMVMDDAEMLDLLRGAWETISTEGRNQRVAGQPRGGSRASRFDDKHRAIHFKDADAYLAYMGEFGRGSMLEAIHGHIGAAAKNIGLMEHAGPNPVATYRLLKDMAEKADNRTGGRESFATLDMVWDALNGTTSQPVSPRLAQIGQDIRNLQAASKLGSAMLSSVTDVPLMVLAAKSSGIPMGDALGSLFRGFGSKAKAAAQDLGIGMDEIGAEMARFHEDHLAQNWSGKLANATMRLSLLEGWTNALRRGFGLTLSSTLGRMRKTDWAKLSEWDRRRFESNGVDEATWKVWQAAVDQGGMLTKDGIYAAQGVHPGDKARAVSKLLGYIDAEAKMAVMAPDIMTRATLTQGTRAGTVGGEVARMLTLFKSFPVAMLQKHLRRIRDIPTGQGKAAYSIAMLTTTTLFGALALQLKDIVNGKDPRDMTTGKFWTAAFVQSGGLGIYSDLLYTSLGGNNRAGMPNWTGLFGPVFGTAADVADMTLGNLGKVATGREADFGADLLRVAKSNTPLLNLWYARAVIDHLVLHDLQEQLSPGYLRRMRRRAKKDWGQDYWWEPGETAPERLPDAAAAVGE